MVMITDACQEGTFHCATDRICIPSWKRCDNLNKDCLSGEDEVGCRKLILQYYNYVVLILIHLYYHYGV